MPVVVSAWPGAGAGWTRQHGTSHTPLLLTGKHLTDDNHNLVELVQPSITAHSHHLLPSVAAVRLQCGGREIVLVYVGIVQNGNMIVLEKVPSEGL